MQRITGSTPLYGVIGYPIHHSLSPVIHNQWIAEANVEGVYLPLAISPISLPAAVPLLAEMGWRGWNVTVPHKESIMPLLDTVDDTAAAMGAVNTVVVQEGKLYGYNTDGAGFMLPLQQHLAAIKDQPVLIVGAGGAARAILYSLWHAGCKNLRIMNRTEHRAEQLCADLSVDAEIFAMNQAADAIKQAIKDCGLVVNTTSLGMTGQPALTLPVELAADNAIIYDIVYTPQQTPLLLAGAQCGFHTIGGLDMLLGQARVAFQHWFGGLPEVTPALLQQLNDQLVK